MNARDLKGFPFPAFRECHAQAVSSVGTSVDFRLRNAWLLLGLSVLSLCPIVGCGGNGTKIGNTILPPTNLVYPETTIAATVGTAISPDTPSATGTVTGYTVSPALPAGLALSQSSGTISGTPTAASANAAYTVTASNSAGSTSAAVQITVAVAPPSNLVYPQATITATVGTAITPDTPTVTGTVTGYTVSPSLPAGLALDPSTGTISGTPTAVSDNAAYTVKAENSSGNTTATVQISVVIAPPTNLVYPQTTIAATVGTAISPDTPTATGTVTSYTVNPALPAGLGLDPSTGTISGTPTAASDSTAYTVTATNSTGHTTATVQIAVALAPPSHLIYPQPAISGFVGQAIAADSPTATGTVASYSVSPALPAGLSLNTSTGTISGTPTATTAQAGYTVTATNSSGSTTATLQIAVNQVGAPYNLIYPQMTIIGLYRSPITADTPTVNGTVTSYTVSPALPTGLSLDPATGTISGTPTDITSEACVVTATNSNGSTTALVTIQIYGNLAPYYETITATVGQAIMPDLPLVTPGTISAFSVSPALPAGLSLNTSNGMISGTPTAAAAQATYAVTGTGLFGSATSNLTITVLPVPITPIFDLGHANSIQATRFEGGRLLSIDISGHWVLWDYAAGTQVASGNVILPQGGPGIGPEPFSNPIDMEGPTAVIAVANGLQVISQSSGTSMATVSASGLNVSYEPPSVWKLASDGSYVCVGTTSGLFVYSPTGQLIVSKPGNYDNANIFGAPGEVQVAMGAAGNNVIETISTADGSSTISPTFLGQFFSWFLDGGRFLTTLGGGTVWVYSSAAVEQAFVSLPTGGYLTGQDNWIWTFSSSVNSLGENSDFHLDVYPIGSTTAAFSLFSPGTFVTAIPSGSTVAVISPGAAQISVIDLSGSTPAMTKYSTPIANLDSDYDGLPAYEAYAASSSSQWVVGNEWGVLFDGASSSSAPRYFGYGQAWSIAGAANTAAISTATGQILIVDPYSLSLQGTIDFSAGKLEMSSDGKVLGAFANTKDGQYETDRTLNFYSLPSEAITSSFPSTYGQSPYLLDFTLAASGTMIGQIENANSSLPYSRQVTAITGGTPTWSDAQNYPNSFPEPTAPIILSPDGTLVAVYPLATSPGVSYIYQNGSLISAIPGVAVGWIDNGQLLANQYGSAGTHIYLSGSALFSPTGAQLSSVTLPVFSSIEPLTSSTVYEPSTNTIYSLTTGQPTWTGTYPSSGVGAVAGAYVVYESGNSIVVESH